jgi:hypothetical protein
MSESKAICFVSYCHGDIDREVLQYVRFLLESRSQQKYEILIDEDVPTGGDLEDFMAFPDKVDAVLILLTPEYKRRVLERKGGVYTEFTRIITRYQQMQDARKAGTRSSQIKGYFELFLIDAGRRPKTGCRTFVEFGMEQARSHNPRKVAGASRRDDL